MGVDDFGNGFDDRRTLPMKMFAGAAEEDESLLFFGWNVFRDAVEGSFGGRDVGAGFLSRLEVVLGDEAMRKEKGGEGGLHDHDGGTSIAPGLIEQEGMGVMTGGENEVGSFFFMATQVGVFDTRNLVGAEGSSQQGFGETQ